MIILGNYPEEFDGNEGKRYFTPENRLRSPTKTTPRSITTTVFHTKTTTVSVTKASSSSSLVTTRAPETTVFMEPQLNTIPESTNFSTSDRDFDNVSIANNFESDYDSLSVTKEPESNPKTTPSIESVVTIAENPSNSSPKTVDESGRLKIQDRDMNTASSNEHLFSY